jgi:hypothetical protein
LLPEHSTFEYRVVGFDAATSNEEAGHERTDWTTLEYAETIAAEWRAYEEVPFSDVWIERRTVTVSEPERIPA